MRRHNNSALLAVGLGVIGILIVVIIIATGHSAGGSSDVQLITPINPDCQTSAQLCQADADLIRNACNGGTTGIGLLLNSAKDDATKSLYEQELTALCSNEQIP